MPTALFKIPFDGAAQELGFIPLEGASGPTTYNETLSEAITTSDVVSAIMTMVNTLSEAVTPAESFATTATFNNTLSESATVADSFASIMTMVNTLSESITVAESVTNGNVFNESLSEGLTVADTLTVARIMSESISETITASDSFASIMTMVNTLSEAVTSATTFSATGGSSEIDETSVYNYAGFLRLAINQLRNKGRGVGYIFKTAGTFDPATDTISGASTVSQTVKMLITDFNKKDIDGTMIKIGDKLALLAPDSLSATPKTGDQVNDDGQKYQVMRIEEIKPGDTTILYKLQLRRGGP